jgi:hypothetical protein
MRRTQPPPRLAREGWVPAGPETRATTVLLTVEVSPTGPSVEEIHSGSRSA